MKTILKYEATESGKQYVATSHFAEIVRDFIVRNMHDEPGGSYGSDLLIGWAITGHDLNTPPKGTEVLALVEFINGHPELMQAASATCLASLMEKDGFSTTPA